MKKETKEDTKENEVHDCDGGIYWRVAPRFALYRVSAVVTMLLVWCGTLLVFSTVELVPWWTVPLAVVSGSMSAVLALAPPNRGIAVVGWVTHDGALNDRDGRPAKAVVVECQSEDNDAP